MKDCIFNRKNYEQVFFSLFFHFYLLYKSIKAIWNFEKSSKNSKKMEKNLVQIPLKYHQKWQKIG